MGSRDRNVCRVAQCHPTLWKSKDFCQIFNVTFFFFLCALNDLISKYLLNKPFLYMNPLETRQLDLLFCKVNGVIP